MFSFRHFSVSTTHYLCRERDSKGVITIGWSAIQRLHPSQADHGLDRIEGQVVRNHTGRRYLNCSLRDFLGRWHYILITLYNAQESEYTATLSPQVSYGTPQNTWGTAPPGKKLMLHASPVVTSQEMRRICYYLYFYYTSHNSLFLSFLVIDRDVSIKFYVPVTVHRE